MPEMKNSLEGFNSSFEVPVKRIREFKGRLIDMIQSERWKNEEKGTEPQRSVERIKHRTYL